jgi:hypothetical protein
VSLAGGTLRRMLDPTTYARIALDPVRLAILGAAAAAPIDPEAIAGALDVPVRRVMREAAGLEAVGLLENGRLVTERLREVAKALPQQPDASALALEGEWNEDEAKLLATFFSGSRLTAIPEKRSKRRVVLERLAQEFEPGVRYDEREVNFTLQLFHADFAALRRYLVDEGLMARERGVYWRTGGRFEVDPHSGDADA